MKERGDGSHGCPATEKAIFMLFRQTAGRKEKTMKQKDMKKTLAAVKSVSALMEKAKQLEQDGAGNNAVSAFDAMEAMKKAAGSGNLGAYVRARKALASAVEGMMTGKMKPLSLDDKVTDEDILKASGGEVTEIIAIDEATGAYKRKGLHDPAIFGGAPSMGLLSEDKYPVLEGDTYGRRFGHIALTEPVMDPDCIPLAAEWLGISEEEVKAVLHFKKYIVMDVRRGRCHGKVHTSKYADDLMQYGSFIMSGKGAAEIRALLLVKGCEEEDIDRMFMMTVPVLPPFCRKTLFDEEAKGYSTEETDFRYRLIIGRTKRLKKLIGLGAPDCIMDNERRLVQEAVESLYFGTEDGTYDGLQSYLEAFEGTVTDKYDAKEYTDAYRLAMRRASGYEKPEERTLSAVERAISLNKKISPLPFITKDALVTDCGKTKHIKVKQAVERNDEAKKALSDYFMHRSDLAGDLDDALSASAMQVQMEMAAENLIKMLEAESTKIVRAAMDGKPVMLEKDRFGIYRLAEKH